MPPKKKGAAAKTKAKAAATTPRATRASVPDTITNSRGKEFETTAALSRPRRESAILQSPVELKKSTTAATPSKKRASTSKPTGMEPPKKRGRPAKKVADEEAVEDAEESEIEEIQEQPKTKRGPGRPKKKVAEPVKKRGPGRPSKKAAEVDEQDDEDEEEEIEEPVAVPKARGRPPKKTTAEDPPATAVASKPTKKRGRPSKAEIAAENEDAGEETEEAIEEPPPKKRGRGRPAKKVADAVPKEETGPPKKRGSSPRGGETTKMDGDDDAAADQLEDELVDDAEQAGSKASAVGGKGKGKGVKGKGKAKAKGFKAKASSHADEEAIDDDEVEPTSSERQYWLMKAEQEDREETLANGEVFNAKFTIDDLKSKDSPEPWDGVRNPTAAKNMRAMKKGDLAFFYASGGKSGRKPGITGIMEIVKEHEPDQTTSDEGSYGYVKDEKARGKWCVVHVEYRNKLTKPVHLSELQKYMEGSGVLSKMQVLKQSRLSVTSVTEEEWNFITENLIEGYEEEDALPGAEGGLRNEPTNGTSNLEEESTLITTEQIDGEGTINEQIDGEVIINESTQAEQDLPPGSVSAGPVLATTESEIPSTDTIFPAETSQTSRAASRGGSRAPSVKTKATTSRQSSRGGSAAADSLAPPATNGRGRSRTPKIRGASALPADTATVGMSMIGEDDE